MSKDLAVSIITTASLSFALSVRGHRLIIGRSFADDNCWSTTLNTLIAEFLSFTSRRCIHSRHTHEFRIPVRDIGWTV